MRALENGGPGRRPVPAIASVLGGPRRVPPLSSLPRAAVVPKSCRRSDLRWRVRLRGGRETCASAPNLERHAEALLDDLTDWSGDPFLQRLVREAYS